LYLKNLKPQGQQLGPLDKPVPPNKQDEYQYNRQLKIAEKPLSILHSIKNGTASPLDMQTLGTLYPELTKALTKTAFEKLVEAKLKGTTITRKQKLGLSSLLNQPMDATQTPQAMQAIIASAPVQQQPQAKKPPTAQTQKTIDKATSIEATPDQARQMDKKA